MLFAYTYVPHSMERMQEFIDFIFYDVWCKAPSAGEFGLNLFAENSALHDLMTTFHYSHHKNADFFLGSVQRIYIGFAEFNRKQIRRVKWWYQSNNSVEKLCRNDGACPAIQYTVMEEKFHAVFEDIRRFFTGLYGFEAAALEKAVGSNIGEHYKAFVAVNRRGRCPFCGISRIKSAAMDVRDAYDHYLPKTIYPFNSINFRNLAPACNDCNSSYKHRKDPLNGVNGRRKAFYPYANSESHPLLTFKIVLNSSNIGNLTHDDITLTVGPTQFAEEIATWRELYRIDARYKDVICSDDAFNWLEEFRMSSERGIQVDQLRAVTEADPIANMNFLRIAFLEACEESGLISLLRPTGRVH